MQVDPLAQQVVGMPAFHRRTRLIVVSPCDSEGGTWLDSKVFMAAHINVNVNVYTHLYKNEY